MWNNVGSVSASSACGLRVDALFGCWAMLELLVVLLLVCKACSVAGCWAYSVWRLTVHLEGWESRRWRLFACECQGIGTNTDYYRATAIVDELSDSILDLHSCTQDRKR